MTLRPFFSYFGAKWRAVPRLYPAPAYETIVEPFAGSAGYSLRYPDRRVVLCDLDPVIVGLWRYLLRVKPGEILALPDVPEGGTVDDLAVCEEARHLIGYWINKAQSWPARRPSQWMIKHTERPGSFWGPQVRRVIADQLPRIRHWEVHHGNYETAPVTGEATWFIDPPYGLAGRKYRCGSAGINYEALALWCLEREGEVIVCEAAGETWLPFREVSSIAGMKRSRPSAEAVWYRGPILGGLNKRGSEHRR